MTSPSIQSTPAAGISRRFLGVGQCSLPLSNSRHRQLIPDGGSICIKPAYHVELLGEEQRYRPAIPFGITGRVQRRGDTWTVVGPSRLRRVQAFILGLWWALGFTAAILVLLFRAGVEPTVFSGVAVALSLLLVFGWAAQLAVQAIWTHYVGWGLREAALERTGGTAEEVAGASESIADDSW